MEKIFAIAAGGAIGALARYFLSGFVHRGIDTSFPLGTLLVNLSGALLIGVLWGLTESVIMPASLRLFIFVGCLGAFTTFSTFCLENINLIRAGEYYFGVLNIVISNVLGVVLVFVGILCSKFITGIFK